MLLVGGLSTIDRQSCLYVLLSGECLHMLFVGGLFTIDGSLVCMCC